MNDCCRDTLAPVLALADEWDREADRYRAAEPVHFRGLAEAATKHARDLRAAVETPDRQPCPACAGAMPANQMGAPLQAEHAKHVSETPDPQDAQAACCCDQTTARPLVCPAHPDQPEGIAERIASLTQPRLHTHCGEVHVPGPCADGEVRPAPDQPEPCAGCLDHPYGDPPRPGAPSTADPCRSAPDQPGETP